MPDGNLATRKQKSTHDEPYTANPPGSLSTPGGGPAPGIVVPRPWHSSSKRSNTLLVRSLPMGKTKREVRFSKLELGRAQSRC